LFSFFHSSPSSLSFVACIVPHIHQRRWQPKQQVQGLPTHFFFWIVTTNLKHHCSLKLGLEKVLESFLLIVNINRKEKCGYRFNLSHSMVLQQVV
jgi:hypothetical protein